MKHWLAGFLFAVAAAVALPVMAQKTVTFAYQDMMNPWRWVQQSQEIEKATGYKINWRQFGGGGDVIRAMASGDVQLGEVGSTGIATAEADPATTPVAEPATRMAAPPLRPRVTSCALLSPAVTPTALSPACEMPMKLRKAPTLPAIIPCG